MRRTISVILMVLATALAAFGVPQGTSWTYQGQLRRSGAAYTGTCNFQFSLWDAAGAGTQQGSTQAINSVNVVNGLFTVVLDFGDLFAGDARWLGTSVQCSGDGGFTPLDPRQSITAAPYALSLRPGARIEGRIDDPFMPMLTVNNSSNFGTAARFVGPVEIPSELRTGRIVAINTAGLTAITGSGGTGVYGVTPVAAGSGVYGEGSATNSAGVFGLNSASAAIWGKSTGAGSAIFGENTGTGFAGRFVGPVDVQGTLTKSAGTFKIDHPLDPAHKFLSHSFVESPEMMNIYNGNVTTDATGTATVTLPAYFAALNRDYRYQLTVLGQFAQAIVSREIIADNTFAIRTDKPGVKVSWQVTGIRQDAYAQANPIVVEESKPAAEQGMYLFPAGFGAGEEKRIGHLSQPARKPGVQEPPAVRPGDQPSK